MELSKAEQEEQEERRRRTRQPALCPVGDCRVLVAHSHLLRHLISEHLDSRPKSLPFQLRLREVAIGQKTLLMLAFRQLVLDRDYCLAVLNWRQPDLKLGPGDLSERQLDLPPCHQSLARHLPVLVMVCRTTWKSLLTHEDQPEHNGWGIVYLLWLLSPATRRPVNATLSVLNSQLQYIERRNRRRIRDFASRMPIQQFINGLDPTYVSLNEDKLERHCDGKGDMASVFVEVTIEGEAR